MIILATTDVLRVVCSNRFVDIDASWVDSASGTILPGRTNTLITTGGSTTTTIVAAPASGVRSVLSFTARLRTETAVTITVQLFNGTTAYDMYSVKLFPGSSLSYNDEEGFSVSDYTGARLTLNTYTYETPVADGIYRVALTSDITCNKGTIAYTTVPEFTIPLAVNDIYYFRAVLFFTSGATTSGLRMGFLTDSSALTNKPAQRFYIKTSLTSTSVTYGTPTTLAGATALASGNICVVEGAVTNLTAGTENLRFTFAIGTEEAQPIVLKAGSFLSYERAF